MRASAAAAHAEIRMRYGCLARAAKDDRRAPLTITSLRTSQLERLFRHRYGGRFPETKDGIKALVLMAEHHIKRNTPQRVVEWIMVRAPWTKELYAEGIVAEALKNPRRWKAGPLGAHIGLTPDERRHLRLTTIRAVGQTDASMAEDRKRADRERQERRRREAGARPRAESHSQTKPWEKFGISRRTWERRGKPMPPIADANSSAAKVRKILAPDGIASLAKVIAPSALRMLAHAPNDKGFREEKRDPLILSYREAS